MRALGVLCVAAAGLYAADQPIPDLFSLVRANDLSGLRKAIDAKTDLNARDKRGATPLMHAAAFGSIDAMQMLVKAGADVNAKNEFGVTALIWAANDLERVRLLVEKGADVNATSRQSRNALFVAVARPGNVATVRYLLEHGAELPKATETKSVRAKGGLDPNNPPSNRSMSLLITAAQAPDLETVKFLLEKGANPNATDAEGNTALQFAAGAGDLEMVRMLIAKGADVNQCNHSAGMVKNGPIALTKLAPIILAAPAASPAVLEELLKAGADVNAVDGRGFTALMAAAASERQSAKAVDLLIAKGAKVNFKNDRGETALDWALKFGNPEVLASLKKAGAQVGVPYEAPAPSGTRSGDLAAAIQKSTKLLVNSSDQYFKVSGGCAGCHHQMLTSLAAGALRNRGIAVDKLADDALRQIKLNVAMFQQNQLQRLDPPGSPDTVFYQAMAFVANKVRPDESTDSMVWSIAAQQRTEGHWAIPGITRPPIEDSDFMRTAIGLRMLQTYGTPGRKAEHDAQVAKARRWLETNRPVTTDDLVGRLLGMAWAGSSPALVKKAAQDLISIQKKDGGWAGNRWLASDAYATGTALWALVESGQVKVADKVFQKGAEYLLSTQYPDGSWYMRSRAPKFQPYFQSGFPYEHDQWISAAATAMAVVGLAPAVPMQRAAVTP